MIWEWLQFIHELLRCRCVRGLTHHSLQVHHRLLLVFVYPSTLVLAVEKIIQP